jgi:ubiquinone/menaquinone biosynthesis C-methylase UbiE
MRRNIRVLDIGSGLGFPLIELAQRLGATCEVYGIDPWTQADERARMKARVWKLNNVTVVPGNAEQLPFTDGFFELVVSNNGTNNVDDEEETLREICRVAKPGGQIVLTMNLPETITARTTSTTRKRPSAKFAASPSRADRLCSR